MRVYYDSEFLEDGRTIDLISIAMVAEDGREMYAVSEETDRDPLYDRICRHRWLMSNVVPHLPLRPGSMVRLPEAQYAGAFHLDSTSNVIMPRRMIRNAVREFTAAIPDIELWAWYGAYDHVVLAQLFGSMMGLPSTFPMWTNDLKQEVHRLGNPALPEQLADEHHALADAHHLKVCAEYVAASYGPGRTTDPGSV